MDNNDRPAPSSYLDGIRAYFPTSGINGKFTDILLISDNDLAEVFMEPGSGKAGADFLLSAIATVRDHLNHIEGFLREGILLTAPADPSSSPG